MAHTIGEDLRATTGAGIESCRLQVGDHLRDGKLIALGEERELHHRERFQMDLRETLLQSADQVEEILEWQVRVQTPYDMKFRHRLGIAGCRGLKGFFERHRVRTDG